MKTQFLNTFLAVMVLAVAAFSGAAQAKDAQEGFIVTTEIHGCDADMQKYCADVTAGDNRPLLCLLAHEDKLSTECQFGILDAALANEMASGALAHAHASCQADREQLCPGVALGEGRIARCFVANQSKLSAECTGALKSTGLWDVILEEVAQ